MERLAEEVEALSAARNLGEFWYGVTWLHVGPKLRAMVMLPDDAVWVDGEPDELPARILWVIEACRDRLQRPARN